MVTVLTTTRVRPVTLHESVMVGASKLHADPNSAIFVAEQTSVGGVVSTTVTV